MICHKKIVILELFQVPLPILQALELTTLFLYSSAMSGVLALKQC